MRLANRGRFRVGMLTPGRSELSGTFGALGSGVLWFGVQTLVVVAMAIASDEAMVVPAVMMRLPAERYSLMPRL